MYTSQGSPVRRTSTPKGQATLRIHHLGPHPIIRFYLERMNLRKIVTDCLGTGTKKEPRSLLTHGEALEILIHNILVAPVPMYRLSEWIEPIEASALGLTDEQKRSVNDDRMARLFDALASPRARNLFFRLALRILKEFSIATDRIHFDTTSITVHGAYEASTVEPAIRHGHNKDHRPDLKQLVFGLNVSADGTVPFMAHLFSGNRTDDTVHQENVEALRRVLGRDDFIYVADSKLCTETNLHYIANGAKGLFVTVLPRTRKEDQEFRDHLRTHTVRWRHVVSIPPRRRKDDPPDEYQSCKGISESSKEGYRLIWIRSSQKARHDRDHRKKAIHRAMADLQELAKKLNTRKLKTKSAIQQAAQAILKGHRVEAFITFRVHYRMETVTRRTRRGRPKAGDPVRTTRKRRYSLETAVLQERLKQEQKTDGVFPILTNLPKSHSKKDVLLIYKYQPYLEKRFSSLKSELCVSPVFLKKPHRVAALIHAYFIAIAAGSLVERATRKNMSIKQIEALPLFPEGKETTTPTWPRILEAFSNATWHDFEQEDNFVTFPLQLGKMQNTLLKLMEVPKELYV